MEYFTMTNPEQRVDAPARAGDGGGDTNSGAAKISADIYNDHSAWKNLPVSGGKLDGYEQNAPTIDMGTGDNTTANQKPENKQPEHSKEPEHNNDPDKQKEPEKETEHNQPKDDDRRIKNEPGSPLPDTKNPINDVPPELRHNPNPPILGLPKIDIKNPINDVPPELRHNPNPPVLGQPKMDNRNPIHELPPWVRNPNLK